MTTAVRLTVVAGCSLAGLLWATNHSNAQAAPEPATAVTFTRDVAPILNRNCTSCHRPGEIAPMSLTSYAEARPWTRAIRKRSPIA